MWRLAFISATAAAIAVLVFAANEAAAQLPVSCGGAIQNCPQGKEMFCNRWKACKRGKNSKVQKFCAAPVCMTKKSGT